MNQFGYLESDWKLYKSKVGDWQEGYMGFVSSSAL